MYKLKKEFRMKSDDIVFLNGLLDNLPGTHLTKKEKDRVSRVYHDYIARHIDNRDWSPALVETEQKRNFE